MEPVDDCAHDGTAVRSSDRMMVPSPAITGWRISYVLIAYCLLNFLYCACAVQQVQQESAGSAVRSCSQSGQFLQTYQYGQLFNCATLFDKVHDVKATLFCKVCDVKAI